MTAALEHALDDNDNCPACTPTSIPVECDDGSIGWVVSHHDLTRADDPVSLADRAATIAEAMDAVRQDAAS